MPRRAAEKVPGTELAGPEQRLCTLPGGDESFDVRELSPSADWRQLSDGGYSEVYKAQLLGLTVAVKQATSRKKTSGEALLREIRYLRLAGAHPNIVTPFGAFEENGRLHLVLEYARHCLRNDRVARQVDPILVLAGVSRALVRLHGLGIVHRDLKARNVLVAPENRALLIDFGLACHITQDSSEWVGRTVGTKKYRPPEMRDGRAATSAIDVYCFGLMVEKLLRQRERGSLDSSPRSEDGRAERRDTKLLHDLASQSTLHEPADRPSAWGLLVQLQRHVGEDVMRCHDARTRVPLSANPRYLLPSDIITASACGEVDGSGGHESLGGGVSGHDSPDRSHSCSRSAERRKRRRSADELVEARSDPSGHGMSMVDTRGGPASASANVASRLAGGEPRAVRRAVAPR